MVWPRARAHEGQRWRWGNVASVCRRKSLWLINWIISAKVHCQSVQSVTAYVRWINTRPQVTYRSTNSTTKGGMKLIHAPGEDATLQRLVDHILHCMFSHKQAMTHGVAWSCALSAGSASVPTLHPWTQWISSVCSYSSSGGHFK